MKSQDIKLDDNERQKCEIWTRVMGYYRPVENYNVGKLSEYRERTYFKEIDINNEMNDTASNNEQYFERTYFKEADISNNIKDSTNTNESYKDCKCFKELHAVNNESNVLLNNKDNILEDCTDYSKDININNVAEHECICDSSIKKAS